MWDHRSLTSPSSLSLLTQSSHQFPLNQISDENLDLPLSKEEAYMNIFGKHCVNFGEQNRLNICWVNQKINIVC